MQNWHLLYNSMTGASVSIGTVISDPLPAGITALPLTDEQGEGLQNGTLKWDEITRSLISPPPPAMVAEEWLESIGIGGSRQPTLLYLRQSLAAASKESPLLNSLEQYLQTILGLYATDPSPRADWPLPPTTFEAAVQQAVQQLNTP